MNVVDAIAGEYRRYRTLAEDAIAQLTDAELHVKMGGGNSTATLMQHLGGNLRSRFTDFLTSDGEKPWRNRDAEFEESEQPRTALFETWNGGWNTLSSTLAGLTDGNLGDSVTIRGVPLTVMEALTRSLSHAAYHAGQIVLIAKSIRGDDWRYLSIPPRGSAAYNAKPDLEKPPGRP